MLNIPEKVKERLINGIKKFQPIIQRAKDKDINESDTVTIITDILSEILGYEKFTEITSEYTVKKTYCDLAVKISNEIEFLIEVKAAGLMLKDDYSRQAVNYGSNSGVDWVILTNGVCWKIYQILFSKPVDKTLLYEFDFLELNSRKQEDLELLYYLSRESALKKSGALLGELAAQKEVLNHFFIGQLLLTDPVLDAIRKQIKKIAPETKVTADEIQEILELNVIKRDVFESERSEAIRKKIKAFEKSVCEKSNKPVPIEEMV